MIRPAVSGHLNLPPRRGDVRGHSALIEKTAPLGQPGQPRGASPHL
jgi:hypothetical protein